MKRPPPPGIRRLLGTVPLVLLAAAACFYADDPPVYRPPALLDVPHQRSGEALYQRDCAWCHGDAGEGTPRGTDLVTGTNGPALTDFMLSTGRMPIDDPAARLRHGPPAYTTDQTRALVRYVASLGGPGPDIPRVRPDEGDLSLGATLYNEDCAACHSTTMIGGALTESGEQALDIRRRSATFAPGLERSSAREIAEAVLTGPGNMPVFLGHYDRHELDSLVAFVRHQVTAGDRGGAALGRVGPVAEGAVAWIVGIGILMVFARWIGTRVRDE